MREYFALSVETVKQSNWNARLGARRRRIFPQHGLHRDGRTAQLRARASMGDRGTKSWRESGWTCREGFAHLGNLEILFRNDRFQSVPTADQRTARAEVGRSGPS